MEVLNNVETLYTEEEAENYLLAVFAGLVTKENLSYEYHEKVAILLSDAVIEGFGGSIFIPESIEAITFAGLNSNIYVFSAAKQYQQVRQLSNLINDLGERADWQTFKKEAFEVFEDYNLNYLRTEFETAVGQAQSARDWLQIVSEKDLFPLLQYKTQNDGLVREEHAVLHNVIRPVDDPFWNTRMPKNGWNCRCYTKQLESGEVTPIPQVDEKDFPPLFQMNPGRDQLIFDPKKHPYFRVARGDAYLRENNYNLPV